MTSLEKQIKLKRILADMCLNKECIQCEFYDKNGPRGIECFCFIRDSENRVPIESSWDIGSAML